jgi:hypothetical protein
LGIDNKKLKKFADECAKLRNDLSHRGGPQSGREDEDYVLDLHRRCGALDPLYHAIILQFIGIPDCLLRKVFSTPNVELGYAFKDVGLDLPGQKITPPPG